MARLILHVGMHKTATTTVQKTFHANSKLLAKHGLIYPEMGRVAGHHGLVTDWINLPPVFHLPEGSAAAWKALVKKTAKGDHTVFLSSEEFSRGHPNFRVDLKMIRPWLDAFDEVKVICTLRDQVSFLQSVYLEISKKKAPPYWGVFLKNTLKRDYGAGLFLNYCALDDHLRTAFAADEIHYVDYHDIISGPGILGNMLLLAGCDLSVSQLERTPETEMANVSRDPLSTWAATMIARPSVADDKLLDLVHRKLIENLGEERKTTLYVRSEINQLLKKVIPWNDVLHDRLATRQPDFELTMQSWPETVAYRNDLKNSFWVSLTNSLYTGSD